LIWDNQNSTYIPNISGVPQGSVIGPLFSNIVLLGLYERAYEGLPRAFKRTSSRGGINVHNYMVAYCDDVVFVFNYGDTQQIMLNIKAYLAERSLQVSDEKTKIFNFSIKREFFTFLGYRFDYVPVALLRRGTLISRGDALSAKRLTKEPGKVLVSIDKAVFDAHKTKLKVLIRGSYNLSVPQLIDLLNPIIIGFTNYFS